MKLSKKISEGKKKVLAKHRQIERHKNINKTKVNAYSLEKKIFLFIAGAFAVAFGLVFLRHTALESAEANKENTYYKFANQYNLEEAEFAQPAAPVEKEKKEEQKKYVDPKRLIPISCWGDSFTCAPNDYTVSYAGVVANEANRIVYNIGAPDDSAKAIAGRQGGVPLLATPFVIPPDKTPVEISVDSEMGGRLDFDFSKNAGLNPCAIKGVEGVVSNMKGKLYFTRSKSGEEVIVYDYEPIVTRGMSLRRGDISLFFFGSDSLFAEPEKIVDIYKKMIAYLEEGNDKYLVIGPVKGEKEQLDKLDEMLSSEFGDKFLSAQKVLCYQGTIAHENYKLKPEEIEAAKNGIIPKSYFSNDGDHFTEFGAYELGLAVDEKLEALGYYADRDEIINSEMDSRKTGKKDAEQSETQTNDAK